MFFGGLFSSAMTEVFLHLIVLCGLDMYIGKPNNVTCMNRADVYIIW